MLTLLKCEFILMHMKHARNETFVLNLSIRGRTLSDIIKFVRVKIGQNIRINQWTMQFHFSCFLQGTGSSKFAKKFIHLYSQHGSEEER